MYLQTLIVKLIDIYVILIIIRAVISWFSPNPGNSLYQALISLTEPVLQKIRKIIPLQQAGFDFSPIIAIILLEILKGIIRGL